MFGLGPTELIIIFAIILLLFGANRIPRIAGALGKSLKEFKKSTSETQTEEDSKESEEAKEEAEA